MDWYVVSVLDGVSNGADRDEPWVWKQERKGQGVHDKLTPTKDVSSYYERFHTGYIEPNGQFMSFHLAQSIRYAAPPAQEPR